MMVVPIIKINDFLDQIGREDLKQERYSWAEIQQISNRVMKKGVTLIRTPK